MNLLIVEDDKETLACLKPSLKAEGFVVDAAEDGETGLYMFDYDRLLRVISYQPYVAKTSQER